MSLIESALKKLRQVQSVPDTAGEPDSPEQPTGTLLQLPGAQRSDKLILVSRSALQEAGLQPKDVQQRDVAGEYRRIKRPLIASATGHGGEAVENGRLIMVASALPGEGKSFTITNLALGMAMEKDITVLLVDADIAKPHISKTFGVAEEPGLVDALLDSSIDVESLVIPTDIPGFCVLPAGRHVESATELLASARMREVVARLAKADSRRVVLFDSPPLLLTSDSRALADVVGQVVLVVRAGVTLRSAVQEAIELLPDGKLVSAVLNQNEIANGSSYYGYGEYGAGRVQSDAEKESVP